MQVTIDVAEICHVDGRTSSVQVVAEGNSHGGLLRAGLAQRGAGFEANLRELAFAVVPVKKVRERVISHVNVRPAGVVEVGPNDAETVVTVRIIHAGGLGNVGKRAIAVVVEQRIACALQSAWSAIDIDTAIFAE